MDEHQEGLFKIIRQEDQGVLERTGGVSDHLMWI